MDRFIKSCFNYFQKHPFVFLFLLCCFVGYLYFWGYWVKSYFEYKSQYYEAMTIAQAIDKSRNNRNDFLVTLKDAQLNCDNSIRYSSGRRSLQNALSVQIQGSSNDAFVVGAYSNTNCQELSATPIKGSFSKISEQLYDTSRSRGMNFGSNGKDSIYELCSYCGEDNSLLGIVMILVFPALLGLAIYLMHIKYKRKRKRS